MKLLLIDDDKIDRLNAIRNLRNSGLAFDVVETASAENGLLLAQSEQFDVILLDFQLPGMDGLEVLTLLHGAAHNSTAIIMLSHSNDEELALKCIEAGAQDFIVKSEVSSVRLKRAILQAKERFKLEFELRSSHEKLRNLAERDTLTGLANRYFFDETLKNAIPMARRENKSLALLMLDLDKFKNINDTMGHDVGDLLLKEVAQRLQKPLRNGDILCRLGGDEFAILVQNFDRDIDIRLLIERIFKSLQNPIEINNIQLHSSVSIGIATFPDCATDANQLMKCADVAMYRSKSAGRNQSHFYSKSIHEAVHKRVELERDLRVAVEENQFELYYQPQVSYEDHRLIGVEALIRWQHPTLGIISPLDFIHIAEEVGLINEIGQWVIRTGCAELANWRAQNNALNIKLSLAVNLSAIQLNHTDFYQQVIDTITKYNIPAEHLELELTESVINRSDRAKQLLQSLSSYGVKLALDDFGTGYSSLSHLQDYPIQIIKIDKSFIQGIKNEKDTNFLRAINAFAKTLNFEIVAEGVETEFQMEICKNLKLDRIQGYYFAKPMPADEFQKSWLK